MGIHDPGALPSGQRNLCPKSSTLDRRRLGFFGLLDLGVFCVDWAQTLSLCLVDSGGVGAVVLVSQVKDLA